MVFLGLFELYPRRRKGEKNSQRPTCLYVNTLSTIYIKTLSRTSSIRAPTSTRTPSLTSKVKPNKRLTWTQRK